MADIADEEKQARESRITAMTADFNSDEEKRRAGLDAMNELNHQLGLLADAIARKKEKQEIDDEISILKETKKKGKFSSQKSERLEELKGRLSIIHTELEAHGLPKGMNMRRLGKLHDQRTEEYGELSEAIDRTAKGINSTAPANEDQIKLQGQIENLNVEITAAEEAKKKAEEIEAALLKINIEKVMQNYDSHLRTVGEIKNKLEGLKNKLEDPFSLEDLLPRDKLLSESEKLRQMLGIKQTIEQTITKDEKDLASLTEEVARDEKEVEKINKLKTDLAALQEKALRLNALFWERDQLSNALEELKHPAEEKREMASKTDAEAPTVSEVQPVVEEIDQKPEKKEKVPPETDIIGDYAALLRAKQRWRNIAIKRKEKPGKMRNFLRKCLGVRKDEKILSREEEIREKFIGAVDESVAAAGDDNGKRAAVEKIYTDVANKFAEGKGRLDKAVLWLRKPAGMAVRIGLGVGLGIAAFATGGVAAAVVGMTVYGVASRYLLVDGMWDKIHHMYTGRARKGEYGMAAQLFYNNAKKIAAAGEKVYADAAKISGKALDEASIKYAHNLGRNRFWKKLAAVAYAVLPPIISGGVADLVGSHKAVPQAAPASPAPEAAVATAPVSDLYTVPKGGGIWHICKAIAHNKMPGFDNLSVADQNIAIDAMKDAVIADPGKYGLEPSEIIPRALDKGGPWLRLGADMHAKDIASFVPKRIMDALGLGNNSLTAAGMKVAVKGAISHGNISKAVAAGHAMLRR